MHTQLQPWNQWFWGSEMLSKLGFTTEKSYWVKRELLMSIATHSKCNSELGNKGLLCDKFWAIIYVPEKIFWVLPDSSLLVFIWFRAEFPDSYP